MPRWLVALIALVVAILLCGGVVFLYDQVTKPEAPPVEPTPIPADATPGPEATPDELGVVVFHDDGEGYGIVQGDIPHGDQYLWTVGQGWNGIDVSSVVHVVIEPGWVLRIPAPHQGTTWNVSGPREGIVVRANQMSDEVIKRDSLANVTKLYVGAGDAPQGYTKTLPPGWCQQPFSGPACNSGR